MTNKTISRWENGSNLPDIQRWIKAHLALIIVCLAAVLAGYFYTLLTEPTLSPIIVIVGFFVYKKLRNDMMIYTEAHAFPKEENRNKIDEN